MDVGVVGRQKRIGRHQRAGFAIGKCKKAYAKSRRIESQWSDELVFAGQFCIRFGWHAVVSAESRFDDIRNATERYIRRGAGTFPESRRDQSKFLFEEFIEYRQMLFGVEKQRKCQRIFDQSRQYSSYVSFQLQLCIHHDENYINFVSFSLLQQRRWQEVQRRSHWSFEETVNERIRNLSIWCSAGWFCFSYRFSIDEIWTHSILNHFWYNKIIYGFNWNAISFLSLCAMNFRIICHEF